MVKKTVSQIKSNAKLLKQQEAEILDLIRHNVYEMQQISQSKGVTRFLFLQNVKLLNNAKYMQDYYEIRDAVQQYSPSWNGLKFLIMTMDNDIGVVEHYQDSLLSIPASRMGFDKIKNIAIDIKETQGNFSLIQAADLIKIIEYREAYGKPRTKTIKAEQFENLRL